MKYIIIVFLFLSVCLPGFAAPISVDIDYACFRNDSSTSTLELYYSFPENGIKYRPTDGVYKGEVMFNVRFKSAASDNSINWIIEHKPDSLEKKTFLNLVSQKSFALKPGDYDIEVSAKDLNDTNNLFFTKFSVSVKRFDNNSFNTSDIELAQSIDNYNNDASANPNFVKNSLYVVPLPSNEVSGSEIFLNSYFEIYNANKYKDGDNKIEYRLIDQLGNEAYYFPRKLDVFSDAFVETISIPLSILTTGVYKYQVSLICRKDGLSDTVVATKKVYLLNPGLPPEKQAGFTENQIFTASEFATLTEEQADVEFRKIKGLISGFEKDEFTSLQTVEAKRRFLFRYWYNQKTDTVSLGNPKLAEFRQREAYANKYFSYGTKMGWETDRGKIVLKYGIPEKKDSYPSAGGERDYEKWFYGSIQGGIEFYFVDLSGTGNYMLVHSTANGEIKDYNWYSDYVQRNSSTDERPNGNQ